MFNNFANLILTVTTVSVVTFGFSVTPALAKNVKVIRNCAAFSPDTGIQTRTTPKFGMHNLVGYYRSKTGIPMTVLIVWDQDVQRRGYIAIPIGCLQSNKQEVIEYP
ncbi:hypothetical protein [uncultured Nostoc sp.]|uniref:hypothetical protein n=1 Tax=uncultured Nostoc sp. TaxID=340711 RepID=UPI0026163FEC|nr:hypothetical protein [uncultured Nostoc sp.]